RVRGGGAEHDEKERGDESVGYPSHGTPLGINSGQYSKIEPLLSMKKRLLVSSAWKSESKLLRSLAALALIALFARDAAAETLRLGYSGATASQLAGALAVEQKLFDLYGVGVELNQSAGLTMIRAVESGSLDVAIVGGGQAVAAYMKGADVRI